MNCFGNPEVCCFFHQGSKRGVVVIVSSWWRLGHSRRSFGWFGWVGMGWVGWMDGCMDVHTRRLANRARSGGCVSTEQPRPPPHDHQDALVPLPYLLGTSGDQTTCTYMQAKADAYVRSFNRSLNLLPSPIPPPLPTTTRTHTPRAHPHKHPPTPPSNPCSSSSSSAAVSASHRGGEYPFPLPPLSPLFQVA